MVEATSGVLVKKERMGKQKKGLRDCENWCGDKVYFRFVSVWRDGQANSNYTPITARCAGGLFLYLCVLCILLFLASSTDLSSSAIADGKELPPPRTQKQG